MKRIQCSIGTVNELFFCLDFINTLSSPRFYTTCPLSSRVISEVKTLFRHLFEYYCPYKEKRTSTRRVIQASTIYAKTNVFPELQTSWAPHHTGIKISLITSFPNKVLVLNNTIVRYLRFSKSSPLSSVVLFTADIFLSSLAFVPFA